MTTNADPDLDLLRSEAELASTPTRRAWAQRLVDRIEGHEKARALLTHSTTWKTTIDPDDHAENRDFGRPEEGPDDRGGPGRLPTS